MTVLADRPGRLAGQRTLHSVIEGGSAYFGVFVVVQATIAFASTGVTVHGVVCLLLVSGAQVALIRRRSRIGRLGARSIGVVLAATTVLGLATLPPVLASNGYSTWFLGAAAFDLLGLTLVGRFRVAWLTMAAMVVACVVWAVLTQQPVATGVALMIRHVGTLSIGTALAVSLRRSNAAAAAFRRVERRRRMEEDVARAREGARRGAVEQVLELAGPTLRAIAEGRSFSAEDRRQMLVLEGALRDQIRTPRLSATRLRPSLDAARRRGVNVLLLDEADGAGDDARATAIAWLAERLDATSGGRFVGRFRDVDGHGVRVSAVADDRGEAVTFR